MSKNESALESFHGNFWHGGKQAAPVMLAYLMVGLAAGVFCGRAGLSVAETGLLALMLYAGSAQFVFAQLYMSAPHAVVSAIFFVNLRHLLYSTALAQQARRLPWKTRAVIGAQLTDETFLTATAYLQGRFLSSGAWMIGLNVFSYTSWFVGSVCGVLLGSTLDLSIFGVDFAGSAMFIALLFPQIAQHARPWAAAVALVSGVVAVMSALWFPSSLAVVIVAVLAATVGVFVFGVSDDDRNFSAKLSKVKVSDLLEASKNTSENISNHISEKRTDKKR